jgi:hypothetical protein
MKENVKIDYDNKMEEFDYNDNYYQNRTLDKESFQIINYYYYFNIYEIIKNLLIKN